jgi:hypothetical protein
MFFLKPAWLSKNKVKALKAIEKLNDEKDLVRAAREPVNPIIRLAAVEKLTDQAELAYIAKNDEDNDVCRAAVKKITDQAALADVVITAKNSAGRYHACDKLTDQTLLADVVVMNAKVDNAVRSNVIKKLNDQSVIAEVALHDAWEYVRRDAIMRLTTQSVLEKIACCTSENDFTRVLAAERLQNHELAQSVCLDIAMKGDWKSCSSSDALGLLAKAENEAALLEVAKFCKSDKIRSYAIRYIGKRNKQLLEKLLPVLEGSLRREACGILGHCWGKPEEVDYNVQEMINGQIVHHISKEYVHRCLRCNDHEFCPKPVQE